MRRPTLLLIVAVAATIMAGAAALRQLGDAMATFSDEEGEASPPVRVIDGFVRGFEYVLPSGSDLTVSSASRRIVEFSAGERGVTIADVTEAATESGLGRADVRLGFPSFFADLERNQGLAVARVTATTLDGHAALQGEIQTEGARRIDTFTSAKETTTSSS